MYKGKIHTPHINSTNDIHIITERLNSCIEKLAHELTRHDPNNSHASIVSNMLLGALTPGQDISLFDLCKQMYTDGYELASFIPNESNVLKDFRVKSSEMDSDPTGKPTHSIYFSHLENIDEKNKMRIAPGWFIWLNNPEEGDTEKIDHYSRLDVLFAKIDSKKIFEVSEVKKKNYAMVKVGYMRDNYGKAFEVPDYANLPRECDGIHIDPQTPRDHGLWGCETTAIWNTRCISEMKCFKGIGEWSYARKPLFEIKTINLFDLCKKMKTQGYEYAAFVPTEISEMENGLIHSLMTTSPSLTSGLDGRPTNSIFFTRLQKSTKVSGEVNGTNLFSPALFDWIYEHISGDYSLTMDFNKYNIVFANINMLKIVERDDKSIPMTALFPDEKISTSPADRDKTSVYRVIRVPDYAKIGLTPPMPARKTAEVYDGIHVGMESPQYKADWGVDTVAVWNLNCIFDMKYFQNTGEWSYATKSLFSGDPSESDG